MHALLSAKLARDEFLERILVSGQISIYIYILKSQQHPLQALATQMGDASRLDDPTEMASHGKEGIWGLPPGLMTPKSPLDL